MRGKTGTFTLLALAGTAIATLAALGGSQGSGSQERTAATTPIGPAFTYQGRLTDGFDLLNRECDLQSNLATGLGSTGHAIVFGRTSSGKIGVKR